MNANKFLVKKADQPITWGLSFTETSHEKLKNPFLPNVYMFSGGSKRNIGKKKVKLNMKDCGLAVGLSPSKKISFIYFNQTPLKMIKNAFYFILKVH